MTRRVLFICLALFTVAAGVRLLVWQNNRLEMETVQSVLQHIYKRDARDLAAGRFAIFLSGSDPPSDANVLLHPPGYSLLMGGFYSIAGENETFRVLQLLLNCVAPVLVFLIGRRLFTQTAGAIAGALVAVAPQFAYHSGLMLPDALSVVPLLGALFFLTVARDAPRPLWAILCGVSIGLSCWLRANALLLPVFFCAAALIWLPREGRWKLVASILIGFAATIAPITIRNATVFRSFIPVSLGAGTTLLEGLGDYDSDGRLGMPMTDEGVMEFDARRHGRPDYVGFLYSPDGVERERARVREGLAVILNNPGWFAAAVAHRGVGTLRMERVPAASADRDERKTTPAMLYLLNIPLKVVQGGFVSATVWPFALIGLMVLLLDAGRWRSVVLLAIFPAYYGSVQALLHTEYRYVLATPHMLMIFAAVGLCFLARKLGERSAGG
jgi:4-amino-4-deoxy-L-arabinose transferase-like glycosyltransferase